MDLNAENRTPLDRLRENMQNGNSRQFSPSRYAERSTEYERINKTAMPQSNAYYDRAACLQTLPLAMAYVPMQIWRNLYTADAGLNEGTIFKELDFPWYPTPCRKER